ncbi:ABC transporter ATP-binding protein [Desulfuromonas versatilis]|uniref:ABC transporter ATP-binding protein n=1 Tax=Desulfuromonas versatilis TaxID=2802975 RepID=A0ABN6DUC8_9BACT|nr:ABC transporter ATP-binding protein [Desulfuromonas versatilis]BCR03479.1 ABC transporter ATP-binding protein [Desulfuromonas versatilis]
MDAHRFAHALIQLRNLSKSFREGDRDRVVLRGANADIGKGEFVVLLGRSGCGKSTLLNLISGIDQPSGGEVLIGGTSLTALSEHQRTLFRRRNIGFIFQFYNLIPTLSVLENLLLPLELKGESGPHPEQRARKLLEQVGLADRAASYPDRLSGGEQQRVAIARALVHEPLLLLADEPTGNLDHETGRQVLELLGELARRSRMTTLMVTHSLEVARLADRVLTIRDGALEEQRLSPGAAP